MPSDVRPFTHPITQTPAASSGSSHLQLLDPAVWLAEDARVAHVKGSEAQQARIALESPDEHLLRSYEALKDRGLRVMEE